MIKVIIITLLAAGTVFFLNQAVRADGAATYKAKCAACHKADGTGNAAMPGTDLTKAAGDCVAIVTDGKGKMPSYKSRLNEAEIKEVCEHIKTLKK